MSRQAGTSWSEKAREVVEGDDRSASDAGARGHKSKCPCSSSRIKTWPKQTLSAGTRAGLQGGAADFCGHGGEVCLLPAMPHKFSELRRKIGIGVSGHKDSMARTALAPKPPFPRAGPCSCDWCACGYRSRGLLHSRAGSLLARSERFELPTLGFEVRCSIQLSYERTGASKLRPALVSEHRLENTSRPNYQSYMDRATPRLTQAPAAGK